MFEQIECLAMEIISTTRGRRDPEGGGLVEDGRSLHGIQPLAGGRQPGAQAGVRSPVARAVILELGGGRRLPAIGREEAIGCQEGGGEVEGGGGGEGAMGKEHPHGWRGERTGRWEHESRFSNRGYEVVF